MPVHLILKFASVEKLADFVEARRGRYNDAFPQDSAVYRVDALDKITADNTFIVAREGDRPEEFRLVVTTTESTTRKV